MRKSKKTKPTSPTEYPAETFVHTEKGYFYILSEHRRFFIITKRVLDSWSPQRVVETTEAAVAGYRVAAKLKFRNGSLIHNLADGKIYLVSQGKRRHVTSPDVLTKLNARYEDVVRVSLEEINLHEEGAPLNK